MGSLEEEHTFVEGDMLGGPFSAHSSKLEALAHDLRCRVFSKCLGGLRQ